MNKLAGMAALKQKEMHYSYKTKSKRKQTKEHKQQWRPIDSVLLLVFVAVVVFVSG